MAKRQSSSSTADPFSSAVETPTGGKASSKANVIFAEAVIDPQTAAILYSQNQVKDAIVNYADGSEKKKQGEALMAANRQTVEDFGISRYAAKWIAMGQRPDSPKLYSEQGGGAVITFAPVDREINLDDNAYADLVTLVGEDIAAGLVIEGDEYKFNSETLNEEIVVDGAKVKVQVAVGKALAAALPKDVVARLLTKKPIFKTKKGALDRAIELVGKNAIKLVEYMKALKTPIQLKPGEGTGTK